MLLAALALALLGAGCHEDEAAAPEAAEPPPPTQHFRSRPDLRPPTVTVTTHAAGTAPGDIFLAPYSGPGQYGPMILDENGAVVYFQPLEPAGTRAATSLPSR